MKVDLCDFLKRLINEGLSVSGVRIRFLDDEGAPRGDDTIIRVYNASLHSKVVSLEYHYEGISSRDLSEQKQSWGLQKDLYQVLSVIIHPPRTSKESFLEVHVN